jgi:hypothetical protein
MKAAMWQPGQCMRRRRNTAVVAGKARIVSPTVLSAVMAGTASVDLMGAATSQFRWL